MWPDIIEKYPEAELHICYGWNLFDTANRTNPERMEWKGNVQRMMNQKGIIHHGRLGKDELAKVRQECGIWAYPTYFTEINCITALDAQKDGLVPVVTNLAALKETVGAGIKIEGDIGKPEVKEEFKDKLIELMGNRTKWRQESTKAKKFAKGYSWKSVAKKWVDVFTN